MKGQETLDLFDFGALLQALAHSRKEGTLKAASGHRLKYIHLTGGRVESVYTTRARCPIGLVLYKSRAIELEDLRGVLLAQRAGEVDGLIGEELLRRGLVTRDQLDSAIRYQLVHEILDVFHWKNLSYEFFPGLLEEAFGDLRDELIRVGEACDAEDLLLRISKLKDDWDRFVELAPSLKDVYRREGPGDDETLSHAAMALFEVVDGRRSLEVVLTEVRLTRDEAVEAIRPLIEEGHVRPLDADELLALAAGDGDPVPLEWTADRYERARELGADPERTCLPLAQLYGRLGKTDLAAQNHVGLAQICWARDRIDVARESMSRAVELRPRSRRLRKLRAEMLESAGDMEAAVAELRVLARLHQERREWAEAESVLRQALTLAPEDSNLFLELANSAGRSPAGKKLSRRRRSRRRRT